MLPRASKYYYFVYLVIPPLVWARDKRLISLNCCIALLLMYIGCPTPCCFCFFPFFLKEFSVFIPLIEFTSTSYSVKGWIKKNSIVYYIQKEFLRKGEEKNNGGRRTNIHPYEMEKNVSEIRAPPAVPLDARGRQARVTPVSGGQPVTPCRVSKGRYLRWLRGGRAPKGYPAE